MRRLNGTEMKALFILSIVVPIGLLTTFKLTGILLDSPTLQAITVEQVSWQMERPNIFGFSFNEKLENTYMSDEASINSGMYIVGYFKNLHSEVYEGRDGVESTFYANATIKPGFSASLSVRFYPDDTSFVWVPEDFRVRQNLTVTRVKEIGTNASEAYILATATDSPSNLRATAHWIFNDQNTENHRLKVTFEITYRNTSIYKKIVLPMLLAMALDVGDTFETAKNITVGEYRGTLDPLDYVDMYAITLQEGQTVNINLTTPKEANFDLYLYNPDYDMVANSTQTENKSEFISHVVNKSGAWYLMIVNQEWLPSLMRGIYTLKVEIQGV